MSTRSRIFSQINMPQMWWVLACCLKDTVTQNESMREEYQVNSLVGIRFFPTLFVLEVFSLQWAGTSCRVPVTSWIALNGACVRENPFDRWPSPAMSTRVATRQLLSAGVSPMSVVRVLRRSGHKVAARGGHQIARQMATNMEHTQQQSEAGP